MMKETVLQMTSTSQLRRNIFPIWAVGKSLPRCFLGNPPVKEFHFNEFTTFSEWVVSKFSSFRTSDSQRHKFSARMQEGPTDRLYMRFFMSHSIYASSRTNLFTKKGSAITRMFYPEGGGGRRHVLVQGDLLCCDSLGGDQLGDRAQLFVALYHPFICIHESFTICGSNMRR